MDQPEFMRPPVMDGDIVPFHTERRVTDEAVNVRNDALRVYQMDTESLLREIYAGMQALDRCTTMVMDHTGVELEVPMSREQISALKANQDTRCKLLNKVLPDLRAQEVSDQKQEQVFDFRVLMKKAAREGG